MATEDRLYVGPDFRQIDAHSIQVMSNASGSAITTLGAMAQAIGTASRSSNGLPTVGVQQKLTEVVNANGQHVGATASGTNFGLTYAAATGASLVSINANSSTIAPVCGFEFVVPLSYIAGQSITLSVNQNIVIGSGTVTTKTLTAAAYLQSVAGASGSNIIATAAQTLTNTATTLSFTLTGTTLTAGARVLVLLTVALTETAASNVSMQLNSIYLG